MGFVDETTLVTFVTAPARAGFPSPADDYMEKSLSLNDLIIRNPANTFLFTVEGNSMVDAYVDDGDLLVVDRSIPPKNGDLALIKLDGGFIVKQFFRKRDHVMLESRNKDYEPIRVEEGREFEVFGKVTFAIHRFGG